eukprot:scaffold161549_cov32-Prasinocladus_malaysianus.AAC.1
MQARAFHGAGIAMYQQGEYDTASHAIRKAIDKLPDNAEIWLSLSASLAKEHKIEEAKAAAVRASKLDPMVKEHLLQGLLEDLDTALKDAPSPQSKQDRNEKDSENL